MSQDNIGNVFFAEWNAGKPAYLGYSTFNDNNLIELSSVLEENTHNVIAHSRLRSIG